MRSPAVENSLETMQNEMNRQEMYSEIVEWLYTNDGAYDSVLDWREAFNQLLREVILEEELDVPTDCICELCK